MAYGISDGRHDGDDGTTFSVHRPRYPTHTAQAKRIKYNSCVRHPTGAGNAKTSSVHRPP